LVSLPAAAPIIQKSGGLGLCVNFAGNEAFSDYVKTFMSTRQAALERATVWGS
jgi:hypothetical protein